jgi:hypothetical protein
MKKYRVQAIVSYVEFVDVEAENEEQAEEIAQDSDHWTTLEPGDWEIDSIEELDGLDEDDSE